jgi:hypothetical protein
MVGTLGVLSVQVVGERKGALDGKAEGAGWLVTLPHVKTWRQLLEHCIVSVGATYDTCTKSIQFGLIGGESARYFDFVADIFAFVRLGRLGKGWRN